MAKFEIVGPDKKRYEITAPSDWTEQQVQAKFKKDWPKILVQNDAITKGAMDPSAGMSAFNKYRAGWGKSVSDLIAGTEQLFGAGNQKDIAEQKRLDVPLMKNKSAKLGNITGSIANFAPTAAIPGANTVTGATILGGLIGATAPVAEGHVGWEKAKNTAFGAVTAGALQKIMNFGGSYLKNKLADLDLLKTQAGPKAAVVSSSRDAGYVIPPSHANPSKTNKILEGWSGTTQTAKEASSRNQAVTNKLVKQALGASDDVTGMEAVKNAQKLGGAAYEPIRSLGRVDVDSQFEQGIKAATAAYRKTSSQFKSSRNREVDTLIKDLSSKRFDADAIVDKIAELRREATTNFRASEGKKVGLAKIQRQIAKELEGLVERNLQKTGNEKLLTAFQEGRKLYAKAATAEEAMNPVTGDFSAQKIGAQLKKGRPLTGELKTVGDFALTFPDAAKNITSSVTPINPMGVGGAAGLTMVTGNYGPLAYIAARPAVRNLLLSGNYQKNMLSPSYGLLTRSAEELANDPTVQYLLRSAGPTITGK